MCVCVWGGVVLNNYTMLKPGTATLEADANPLRIYLICCVIQWNTGYFHDGRTERENCSISFSLHHYQHQIDAKQLQIFMLNPDQTSFCQRKIRINKYSTKTLAPQWVTLGNWRKGEGRVIGGRGQTKDLSPNSVNSFCHCWQTFKDICCRLHWHRICSLEGPV